MGRLKHMKQRNADSLFYLFLSKTCHPEPHHDLSFAGSIAGEKMNPEKDL